MACSSNCSSAPIRSFRSTVDSPAVAALVEPLSVAVRAVNRSRLQAGERAVVLGAGPIGQCICLAARERGAEVLIVDLQESRLALARELGAETLALDRPRTGSSRALAAGPAPGGPPVAFDATGARTRCGR